VVYTADNWPITAALLQFPALQPDGSSIQDAEPSVWVNVFRQVAEAGFAHVDLTDSWVRPGDLSASRLGDLASAATEAGVGIPAISSIRRSVIDAEHGSLNLEYSHRTIDAAAALGIRLVSFGLHQALTARQKEQLWFWTVEGHRDPDDPEIWQLAVERLRELGKHAEEVGVLLSLEMYEDTYLGTADSSVRLVTDIGLDNVGINPDVGNLIRLHRPIENWRDILAKVLPYSNYWHVKNYFRDEDPAAGSYVALPAPLELGIISYREAIAMAIAAGYQGMICTEHYGGDGLSVSATNQRYLRSMVLPKQPYDLPQSRVAQTGSAA
jgi:sugar phosphate isomerase/epimerase